ncbi:hypothetical protein FKM82_019171 [Ascaphus truei]
MRCDNVTCASLPPTSQCPLPPATKCNPPKETNVRVLPRNQCVPTRISHCPASPHTNTLNGTSFCLRCWETVKDIHPPSPSLRGFFPLVFTFLTSLGNIPLLTKLFQKLSGGDPTMV